TKKKVAASAAAVLIAALLLGGAFAWTDFSQAFKNLFHGTATPDVLLHDDFAPGKNKDVYVENTGDVPLVVRVQFAEFLQVGNDVKIGTDAKDSSTWRVRQWAGVSVGSDGTVAANDNLHDWLMSGAKKWYLPGTSEIGDVEYKGAVTGGNGNTTKETLTPAPVILLSEYVKDQTTQAKYDADNPDGFWILDDSATGNGWCYWSKLLPAGEATNLLLDNVTLDPNNKPDDNYAYNIDVRLQAANKTEAYKLGENGDISPEAKDLAHDLAADVLTADNGTLFRSTTVPGVFEILNPDGTSKNPREYVYDADNSLGKDKKFSGDELPCDKNGTITLSNGSFAQATDNPNVFKEVNADGTPTTDPPTYLYTPTRDPNNPVGEGPMITGQDGLPYIKTDDTHYINTVNDLVIITPDANTKPGGPDDVVQAPTWPSVATQAIKFWVLPIPSAVQGDTCQIQVEFNNPSQEASAKPLRYILAEGSVGNISINPTTGELTTDATTPINNYSFYVIAADGSFAAGSIRLTTPSTNSQLSAQMVEFSPISPFHIAPGQQLVLGLNSLSSWRNILNYNYTIQGNSLGCNLTSNGLFTAGNTPGTVTVELTVSCVNYYSGSLALQDGSGRIIPTGGRYDMSATFDVVVDGQLPTETQPYITKLTGLGVTSWDDVKPAPDYAGGNGSQGMPYQISSIRQLKKFATDKSANAGYGKYFELTADMDFDGADLVNGALLGDFYGNLNGQDHKIENLVSSGGIFNVISYGTVSSLGRAKGGIQGSAISYIGAFALRLNANANLIRCYNTTDFVSAPVIGGCGFVCIIGGAQGSATISNCYNTGTVMGATTGSGVAAGLATVVQLNSGNTFTIENSYNSGDILSNRIAGGIIGYEDTGASGGQTVALNNVRNYGQVIRTSSTNTYFGGIVGSISTPVASDFVKLIFNNVSYAPGQIIFNGSATTDIDIGIRPVAPATWATGITVTGQGTNTLAGTQTGFMVP
ncbi:MAG: hypothetical protein FWD65_08695, partial [Coriobacteriia bacterium]|nr:hypothetical protein [Coriobacteriia bacterium]